MNFFTTKQTAELWGISPRRVALLAAQGRIEGAISKGNTWLIPENAQKPADSRRKEQKESDSTQKHGIFPYPICVVNSEEKVSEFNREESELYRACLMHENIEFEESCRAAEALLPSDNLNIHLAALYLLAYGSLYRADYPSAEKYALRLRTEYHSIENPDLALRIMYESFEAEFGRYSVIMKSEIMTILPEIDTELLPFFAGEKLLVEVLKYSMGGKQPDISVYEVICRMIDADGYYYSAMFMHTILSQFYAGQGTEEREISHLRRALDICVEHDIYLSFATLISSCPEAAETLLESYPPQAKKKVRESVDIFVNARAEYSEYLKKKSPFSRLNEEDYRLISCCLRNHSIKEMADKFGLSRSGINRRLAILYEKMGVDSQKEMKKAFANMVLEWGI